MSQTLFFFSFAKCSLSNYCLRLLSFWRNVELKLGGGKMFLGLEIVNIQNGNFPLSAGFCVHSFPDL